MAAPRRYSSEQRAAMFYLYQEGLQPAAIARACAEGVNGVGPFQIPRRSVQDIVKAMQAEAHQEAFNRELEHIEEFSERMNKRIERILETQITIFDRKLEKGRTLSGEELKTLSQARRMSRDMAKSSKANVIKPSPTRRSPQNGSRSEIDRLAEEMNRQREAENGESDQGADE